MRHGLEMQHLRLLEEQNPRYVAIKILVLLGCLIGMGGIVVQTESLGLKIVLWAGMGFILNGWVQLLHDAWHHNLFRSRWANALFGHITALFIGIMYEPARHSHILHHKYNRSPADPDAYNVGPKSWHLILLFYAVIFCGGLLAIPHFNLIYPLKQFDRRQQKTYLLQFLLFISLWLLILIFIRSAGLSQAAFELWLMPLVLMSPWYGFKSVADHYRNDWEGSEWRTATTVTSNKLVTYLWNGLNYHLEHHLFPGVPGYHLAKINQLLQAQLHGNKALVFRSYLYVWWKGFWHGPTFIADQPSFLGHFLGRSKHG